MRTPILTPVQQQIRLLVIDEGFALGGVERMWLALMPELSLLCEKVVWMLPGYRLAPTQEELPFNSRIAFEPLHRPHRKVFKLKAVIFKLIAKCLTCINSTYLLKVEQYLFSENLEVFIRKHQITHVLYTALFAQPFPNLSVPTFATVHDVNYHPFWHDKCTKNLEIWAKKSHQLLANSEFTKNEVERACSQARGKIVAVPLASNELYSRKQCVDSSDAGCLFYPASFNLHKGHVLLLKSLHQLHNAGIDFRLILTGSDTLSINSKRPLDIASLEAARQVLASASDSFRQKITVHGRVSTEEVDICYANASLVVLPSSYEGFGLPLAEAVARGKRVVCSDIPAFREQVALYGFNEAVTFVSGANISAWASAIQVALRQPPQSPYSPDDLRTIFERRTWSSVAVDYVRVLNERP